MRQPAAIALALVFSSGCATVNVSTRMDRAEKPETQVQAVPNSETVELEAKAERSDGSVSLVLDISTKRQCTTKQLTHVTETPIITRELAKPGWVVAELLLGTALMGGGLTLFLDRDNIPEGPRDSETNVFNRDHALYGAIGAGALGLFVNSFALANAIRARDSVGDPNTFTEENESTGDCEPNPYESLSVAASAGDIEWGTGTAAKSRAGYRATMPITDEALATTNAESQISVRIEGSGPAVAKVVPLDASDVPGLLDAAQSYRAQQSELGQEWLGMAEREDLTGLENFARAHPTFVDLADVHERIALLRSAREAERTLSSGPDGTTSTGATVQSIYQAASLTYQTQSLKRAVRNAACDVASQATTTSGDFEYVFRFLRAHDTPALWPCSKDQTNTLWMNFREYFTKNVEIRGDFEGGFAYLERWHTVLGTFIPIAESVRANRAKNALERMQARVNKAIKKLPPEEACRPEAAPKVCGFHCDAKSEKRQEKCIAGGKDEERCAERAVKIREECMTCCQEGGSGCARKSPLRCVP